MSCHLTGLYWDDGTRTWYWAGGDASTLDATIALVKSMGIELVFFGSFMNNIGDYTSDPVRAARGPIYLSVKFYPFKLPGI